MTPGQLARDRRVEAAVRARFDREEGAHVRSLARYEVAVLDGLTTLTGHVRSRQTAQAMKALAAQVAGVAAVQDRLVADDELVARVASAIGRTARHRASRLVVRAELGHLRIGGVSPPTRRTPTPCVSAPASPASSAPGGSGRATCSVDRSGMAASEPAVRGGAP